MIKKIIIGISVISIIGLLLVWSLVIGIIQFNNPSMINYPVRGVDVSSYQGDIDWQVLSSQNISFAFIKATEGSSFVDDKFLYNWNEAIDTKLKIGAYHFFSYESSGINQAEHFIATVPLLKNTLPPVIDIEFYGKFEKSPVDSEIVNLELKNMLNRLEEYYGTKPIIYSTEKSYDLYIKDKFEEYPQWARSVYTSLSYINSSKWTFWQYTNREKLYGYNGKEKYIDMNCFNGTNNEFEMLYS